MPTLYYNYRVNVRDSPVVFTKQTSETTSVAHDCGDSRLSCVDCCKQICPKCMVVCTVGNRCAGCGNFKVAIGNRPTEAQRLMTMRGAALILGSAYAWMQLFTGLGGLSFCFWIVFWAAGRVVGQHFRRDDDSLLSVLLFFVAGMFTISILVPILQRGTFTDLAFAVLPCLLDTGLMALGFWMGKCGFG